MFLFYFSLYFDSFRDDEVRCARRRAPHLKAAGAPQHLTFLCVPKEKSAKERAPC
jgi:hypothetical protein